MGPSKGERVFEKREGATNEIKMSVIVTEIIFRKKMKGKVPNKINGLLQWKFRQ